MNKLVKRVMALLAVVVFSGTTDGFSAEKLLYTNRTRFQIPFQIESLTNGRVQAKEVRLFVTSDGGQSWKKYSTAKPGDKRFKFEAKSGDGEYWFDVRVVGADGKLYPEHKTYNPSLKVAVDTTEPEIEIRIGQMTGERVGVTWIVRDTNFDEKSLVLEYKQPGQQDWQPMGIVPRVTGGTAWSVEGLTGEVGVRARANDTAGNTGTTEKKLTLKEVKPEPEPEVVQPTPSVADAANPFAAYGTPAKEDSTAAELTPSPDPTSSTTDAKYPDAAATTTSSVPSLTTEMPAAADPAPYSDFGPGLPENGGVAATKTEPVDVDSVSVDEVLGSANSDLINNGVAGSEPPPAATHRLVNNRRFHLDYALGDVGSSGVSKIEFFITEDGGKKWWKYGNDTDLKSPFNVVVPHDGVFGFAIRATSGAGYAGPAPRGGEAPGLVVEVDSSKPKAVFKAFSPSGGRDLRVAWTAEDKNLARNPIAISVSETKTGPWTTISDWIANTGEIIWTPPKGLPHKMFFKLSAKDTAGNIAEFQTAKPVIIDFSRPTARLIDIEVRTGL